MNGMTGGSTGPQVGVRVTSPLPGQVLVFDGTGWVNGSAYNSNTVNVVAGDLDGDGSITQPLRLATTTVLPLTYDSPTSLTADSKGRLTSVTAKVPSSIHAVSARTSNNLASSTSQGTLSFNTPLSPFNTILGSALNAATGTYTAPAAGFYAISFSLTFPANATGYRSIQINAGGTSSTVLTASSSTALTNLSAETLSCSCTAFLNQGDTVTWTGQQNSGGVLVLTAYRSIYYLGPN